MTSTFHWLLVANAHQVIHTIYRSNKHLLGARARAKNELDSKRLFHESMRARSIASRLVFVAVASHRVLIVQLRAHTHTHYLLLVRRFRNDALTRQPNQTASCRRFVASSCVAQQVCPVPRWPVLIYLINLL